MKRIGLFLLAVVMVVGLAGCKKDHDADPVGTWAVAFDFACNGLDGSAVFHFFPNNTFTDSFGSTGTWSANDDSITINMSDGITFSGTVENNNAMSGVYYLSSGSGCWTATKTSDTP